MPAGDPSALEALTRSLGTEPPESVAALPADVLSRLVTQIDAGRASHERAGVAALEHALKGVPLPFRGLLKKALL